MADTQPRDPAPPAGEEDRITTIEQLAERQDRTEGKLDQVLDMLGGRGQRGVRQAHDTDRQVVEARLDRGSRVQDEMRQAVRDVRAEEAAEEARRQHDADHARLREARPEPEIQPREVMVRGKARLQQVLFGADR